MKWIGIVLLFIPILIACVYLVYVRGLGVSPTLVSPEVIRIGKKTYKAHWEIKSPMPTARVGAAAVAIGSRIFVVGGMDGFGRTLGTVELYDTIGDRWTKLPDLPKPRHHAGAAVLDGVLYVIGGIGGSKSAPTSDVYAYYEGSNEWVIKASLPTPRSAFAIALMDRSIYAIGGIDTLGETNELAMYRPDTDAWEIKTPALTKRDHLEAAGINGKLYVAGGRSGSIGKPLALLEIYDTVLGNWTFGAPMPSPRGGIGGVSLEGLFIVAGGERTAGTFWDMEGYDPKSKKWISFPRLPTARQGMGVAAVGSTIFTIGGGTHPGFSVSGINEAMYFISE